LLYELLKIEHEELKEHNKVNEEFIEELQKKVRELENKDEGEWW
jgi:nicotinamide mononucleotide (NMN) deamidase PncC